MIHEILPVGPLHCNCSVIGDEQSHEQIVITHAHIDHVGGAMKLRALTGAPILLNQNDYALLKMLDVQAAWIGMAAPGKVEIDQSLGSNDVVKAGTLAGQVLHTPGHTEGSICLYFPLEKTLIAGDTLFAGSIGRTDLPGGSMQKIMQSLHGTVLALPDNTRVVPGHGDRKSTRLNSSHGYISYAVFCLKKKNPIEISPRSIIEKMRSISETIL